MRPAKLYQRHFRRGTITVIVVAFLTLLAVVGLTFLIASQNYSVSSRTRREHENREDQPVPIEIINSVFGDIIYDAPDDYSGAYKGIRGHSLARSMYGLHPNPGGGNGIPYAGIGRARGYAPQPLVAALSAAGLTDDYSLINYTYFRDDGFVRDPERSASAPIPLRATPGDPVVLGDGTMSTNQPVYWPWNANYTYPDENNVFLAAIDWSTGKVLQPSYYRTSAFGPAMNAAQDPWALAPPTVNGLANPIANPNWTNAIGKYKILRPRPNEHPNFPYPKQNSDFTYGDVENLRGKNVQQYDSFWMDFDFPVKTWRGKQYKPMVALLVVDLDGRLNVNVGGNARGQGGSHGANQGWGPWEIDLSAAMNGNATDAYNLLYGLGNVPGRYGRTAVAATPPVINKPYTTRADDLITDSTPVGGYLPHFYAPVDFDGSYFAGPTPNPQRWRLPNNVPSIFEQFAVWGPNTQTPPQPYDFDNRYWNGETYPPNSERVYHPSLFNPYMIPAKQTPQVGAGTTEPRVFSHQEMAYLMRNYTEANANFYQQTPLGQLVSSVPASALVRSRLTTMSTDLDRPGATPTLGSGSVPTLTTPVAPGQPPTFNFATPNNFTTTPQDADATRRSMAAVLGAIDINRPLTDYRTNTNDKYSETNIVATTAAQALRERQRLAADVYVRLRAAVGAGEIVAGMYTATTPSPQYDPLRYLAQLAVNIVDYIDNDDYITVFDWTTLDGVPTQDLRNDAYVREKIVFGTELSRLVINEAFSYYTNDPLDPGIINPGMMAPRATTNYIGKVWIELHNPLTPTTAQQTRFLSDDGDAVLASNAGGTPHDVYQLAIYRDDPQLRMAENTRGTPYSQRLTSAAVPWPAAPNELTNFFPVTKRVKANVNGNYGPNDSFLVVGPTIDSATNMRHTPCVLPDGSTYQGTAMQPTLALDSLQFDMPLNANPAQYSPTVVLRRLANQHLPPGADNPYVTVDTLKSEPAWLHDHITHDQAGAVAMARTWQNAYAYGRPQPYQGFDPATGFSAVQQSPIPNPMNNVKMTFGRHNGQDTTGAAPGTTLVRPFDWPVHLDRAVISAAELAHVSAHKPFEFSYYFRKHPTANPPRHLHTADWFGDGLSSAPVVDTRLYRAFDLLHVPSRIYGMGSGGRVPGKININTMNYSSLPQDRAVFDSVCHMYPGMVMPNNPGNKYTVADTQQAWNALNAAKWQSGIPAFNTLQDRPFMGTMGPVGIGGVQYPGLNATGISRTILQPFLQSPAPKAHPYERTELLQTVMNNFTTRSNTFAVYATIGYFEVEGTNTDGRPRLGREIVTETGSVARHRFFAMIDRTNLTADRFATGQQQAAKNAYFSYEPVRTGTALPTTTQVTVATSSDTQPGYVTLAIPCTNASTTAAVGYYDGGTWSLGIGSRLLIDYQADAGKGTFGAVHTDSALVPQTTGAMASRARAEMVQIPNDPNAILPDPGGQRVLITVPTTKPHARGATVILLQTSTGNPADIGFPGNPGPQRNFNYMDARYRPVIPHVEQTE